MSERSIILNHYSLLYRGYEQSGLLKWCRENRVLFFTYMVLEQGALTGKYTEEILLPERAADSAGINAKAAWELSISI